jgi:hypothetical protein
LDELSSMEEKLLKEQERASLQSQVAEFDAFLEKGLYADAAWATIRMRETLNAEVEKSCEPHLMNQEALKACYDKCEAKISQVPPFKSDVASLRDFGSWTLLV